MQKGLAVSHRNGTFLLAQEMRKVVEECVISELGESTLFRLAWPTRWISLTLGVSKCQ